MRGAIWYHLYNFKKVKNTHGGVLLLVKSQALIYSNHVFPIWNLDIIISPLRISNIMHLSMPNFIPLSVEIIRIV